MIENGKDRGASHSERLKRVLHLANVRRSGTPAEQRQAENAIAIAVVDKNCLAEDRMLADTRFIRYRYLSAYQATELFAEEFNRVYRDYHRLVFGRDPVCPHVSLAHKRDRVISSLWRARQAADAMGMDYWTFIRSGAEYMARESGKKWIPRPNQLCSEEQIERAIKKWSDPDVLDTAMDRFPLNADPRFYIPNFVGDPAQLAALDAIASWCMTQQYTVGMLAKLLGVAISEEQARARFPAEVVDAAISRRGVRKLDLPSGPLDRRPYLPPCFGLAPDASHIQCKNCPVLGSCQASLAAAKQSLRDRIGTDDPRLKKRREADRRRQKLCRERKRKKKADVTS